MNIAVQSWLDLQVAMPIDPRSVVLNSQLGVNATSFTRSTNLLQSSYGTSPLAFTGNNTTVVTLDGTDASTTADAAQWVLAHKMVNVAANVPPTMQKVVFMRAGKIWDNQLEINFGGTACNNVQLTFRDNLATSGQFLNGSTGSVPAIVLGTGITNNQILHLTIAQPGIYSMILGMSISSVWSTFEMEWIVLP